jgi:hypothetical protein
MSLEAHVECLLNLAERMDMESSASTINNNYPKSKIRYVRQQQQRLKEIEGSVSLSKHT